MSTLRIRIGFVALVALMVCCAPPKTQEPAPETVAPTTPPPSTEAPKPSPDDSEEAIAKTEPVPPPRHFENRSVEVHYGTNRDRASDCLDSERAPEGRCVPNEYYEGKASPQGLEVGWLTVTFPPTHEVGRVERPMEIFTFQLEKEDPDKHVVIASIEMVSDKNAWARRVRDTGRGEALLFVHGYNVDFDSAARQTAQIAYDLDYEGLPLLYSWPSRGTLAGYFEDEKTVAEAESAFEEFLDLVTLQAGITTLHVMAHSMGNRLVAETLNRRFDEGGDPLIDQLILAAPDIDAQSFETRFASTLPRLARRTTLYVSNRDIALLASAQVHDGKPRAGHRDGGLLGLSGLDTVDASAVDTDFLDHSYYAKGESVLADIFCLLEGAQADARSLLEKFEQGPRGPYWAVLAAEVSRSLGRDPSRCTTVDGGPTQETEVDDSEAKPGSRGSLAGGWGLWLTVGVVVLAGMALIGYRVARRRR